jgi:hypothetical protein
MKTEIKQAIKQVLSDRGMTALIIVFLLACIVYAIYVAALLRPSELQVAVHYTAFGDTNFYRERWYYLLSFVGFGLLLGVAHSILAVKLYLEERRQLAVLFLYLSLFLVVVAWFITRSVLSVAFPV